MARQSRSRPAARPAAPKAAPQQTRGAHTSAAQPPAHAPAPGVPANVGQKQPGMFAQMASTAAGVAVGSTVGHGLSSMLFGGGSQVAPEAPVQQQSFDQQRMGGACEIQAKDFTQCLNASGNDFNACSYYLEALKGCQQAASQY